VRKHAGSSLATGRASASPPQSDRGRAKTVAPLRTTTGFVNTRVTGAVSDVIVYIDISEVREGALDELKTGLKDLADFIEAKEPQPIA
jgi:hypothetical protein